MAYASTSADLRYWAVPLAYGRTWECSQAWQVMWKPRPYQVQSRNTAPISTADKYHASTGAHTNGQLCQTAAAHST